MIESAVAKYLDVLDLVTFDATGVVGDCFIATMPSSPDEAVAIMPTGGFQQPTRAPVSLPTLQLIVRGPKHDPRPPLTRARAIYDALEALDLITLDAGGAAETFVIGTTALQSAPVGIGKDELDRHEFSLNFAFRIHQPTSHRPAAV